jgi:hypothetical protein
MDRTARPGGTAKHEEAGTMLSFETFHCARTTFQSLSVLGYLDPGTGSMVFQVLVAGLLTTSFFVKTWAKYVRDSLLLMKSRKS